MKIFANIIELITYPLVIIGVLVKHFRSINDYVVKSDDENIEILLENDSDKVIFQTTVEQMLKKNEKTRKVTIKNRDITISI